MQELCLRLAGPKRRLYFVNACIRSMPDQTMIRVPVSIRERLRKYGVKGQSYADILNNLMDEVDYRKFVKDQLELLDEAIAGKDRLTNLRDL